MIFTVTGAEDTLLPLRSVHESVNVASVESALVVLVPEEPESGNELPLVPVMRQESAVMFVALQESEAGVLG